MDVDNVENHKLKKSIFHNGKNEISSVPVPYILIFLLGTIASCIVLEFLPTIYDLKTVSLFNNNSTVEIESPKFAIYGKSKNEGHLAHILQILDDFGFKRTSITDEWDLLWAHDYPFLNSMLELMKNLKPHQMVNHLPGCGFITNKVDLCTTGLPFLPRAFRLPDEKEEFLDYSTKHPEMLFVKKNNEHRDIKINAPSDMNLSSSISFVQEFIDNPFLVDGYKFDIGIYVVITSIEPLRVYIYTGDVLFRFCPVKYYPFDPNNIDKYVVGDDYLPIWDVPSLKKYYRQYGGSMRSSFDAYVREQSLDPTIIWPQVEHIIRQTILTKEGNIAQLLRNYKTKNFFELMRFDLIIDKHLRVYLMEANMSPNLSSAHFQPNALLYEQILYSAFNLLGIGSPIRRTSFIESSLEVEEMVSAEKNLAVNLNVCAEFDCDAACNIEQCNLCLPCMSGTDYEILRKAHREHLHRTDMKRIFPQAIFNLADYNIEKEVRNMTKKNAWMTRWFYAKCQQDHSWCY